MRRLRSSSIKSRGAAFLALLVCLFGLPAFGQPWDGNGVEGDPYLIYDACDMQAIGADSNYWDAHFKLMADIDLSAYTGTSFNTIGSYVSPEKYTAFTGVFDGDGHTISNFTYTSTGTDFIGLFEFVGDYYGEGIRGDIKGLVLIDPNVEAGTGVFVGSLVGALDFGAISNCYVEGGSVSGSEYVGGLVGAYVYNATISNCYVESSVVGVNGAIGGLAGANWGGFVSGCYAAGAVLGQDDVGGLVGKNYSATITNCYSSGSVSGNIGVGGLVGGNGATDAPTSTISDCYSVGSVSGDSNVGGLIGNDYGCTAYIKCFWDSDVNPDVNGIGNGSDPNVIGETTANMQTESTFTDAGWDFVGEVINGPNDVWTICEGEDYPRLAWEKYGGGNGTEANPYLIRTSCQMNAIGADSNDWDAHFRLTADIDLSGYTGTSFNIIGNFGGVFDGNGYIISNFSRESAGGIFGVVDDANAEVRNLTLVDPNVSARWMDVIAALVGSLENGSINDCHVKGGRVWGAADTAGLVGIVKQGGIILNCSSDCYVRGPADYSGYSIGGLVGTNRGQMSNCYATGDVNCLECNFVQDAGGLAGRNVGGSISNSWASGRVTAPNDGLNVYEIGGLVGGNSGTITRCYATGFETSGARQTGGLVGLNSGTISTCYASPEVTGVEYIGGLVGKNSGSVEYSFWDVNTSGQASSAGGTGKTTVEMQTESTFTDAGWDFVGEVINGPNDIWTICEGTNYPKFVWQIPAADFVCPDGVNFIDYAFFAEHWLQSIYGGCGGVELTGDGKVNWVDFAVFAGYWKLTGCGECGGADFTGDENVDLADLYVFATYWLGFEYAEVDLTNDGRVGLDDLREFAENWLAGV